jgi:hypothetical protein
MDLTHVHDVFGAPMYASSRLGHCRRIVDGGGPSRTKRHCIAGRAGQRSLAPSSLNPQMWPR